MSWRKSSVGNSAGAQRTESAAAFHALATNCILPTQAPALIHSPHPVISLLKPAPDVARLPADRTDREYRRLRWKVFAGIFIGYAAYYLVRKNFALAIPDILRDYPQYTKAQLGTAMTGLSIAYGVSKFLMGAVSDRSNPRWFLPLGLLLSCGVLLVFGFVKAVYASLFAMIALQTLNGWFNGMGWPPCGKTMVHWWSPQERGRVVAFWNVAHNVGGGTVSALAFLGVMLFHDWGAKFYFNACVAAGIAIGIGFRLRDTPQSCGLPPVEEYRNDYPENYCAAHEHTFTFREIFLQHVLPNKSLWAIAFANAFAYFVRYGVVDWIPTYLQTAKGFSFQDSSLAWSLIEYVFGSAFAGTGVGWIADRWGCGGVFGTMAACCVLTILFSALTLGPNAASHSQSH